MSEVADIIGALATWLKADAGVLALVSDRVFGIELPKDQAAAMPRKAVVLQPSGGPSPVAGSTARLTAQRLDAVSYGETPYEADRLRRVVFVAMKSAARIVASDTLIHWIEDAGGAFAGRDRDGRWPFAAQSFQVFFAERAIA